MTERIKRAKLTNRAYKFDGDQTLVTLTRETTTALYSAMAAHAWPFIAGIASYVKYNSTSNIVHFEAIDPATEKVPADYAIATLKNYMPILEVISAI